MKTPESCYGFEGTLRGETAYLLAPGPSLADFPVEKLVGRRLLVVNSAVELTPDPWLWMYADKRFSWKYKEFMKQGRPPRALVAKHQVTIQRYYAGKIYFFQWQMKLRHRIKGARPWWRCDKRQFLPGRCSVINNALSFLELTGAEHVIMIGVDFECRGDQYYAPGICFNQGPTRRERALSAGRNWFVGGRKRGLWEPLRLSTTSEPWAKFSGLPRLTIDEALEP